MPDNTSAVSFSTLEIKANYTCNSRCIFCCAGNRGGLGSLGTALALPDEIETETR